MDPTERANLPSMKRLFLLRHAKSSWDDPDLDDHERPLARRGRKASKRMAGHLGRGDVEPQLVLCSSARRTRETLERISPALGEEASVLVERELYAASADELLERLRRVPDETSSVMLIGHNPGIARLALLLGGLERKYPTGALATLAFEGSWGDLGPEAAGLVDFVRPKDLE
jgi:phosphohistidine phosphatase